MPFVRPTCQLPDSSLRPMTDCLPYCLPFIRRSIRCGAKLGGTAHTNAVARYGRNHLLQEHARCNSDCATLSVPAGSYTGGSRSVSTLRVTCPDALLGTFCLCHDEKLLCPVQQEMSSGSRAAICLCGGRQVCKMTVEILLLRKPTLERVGAVSRT